MSKNRVLAAALIVMLGSVPAFAQDVRPELSITFGWTFSDGVSGDPVVAGGQIFDRVDPKDSFNWGLGFGFPVNENVELGFLFGQQTPSKLVAGGTSEFEIGDFTTNTYHGYFGYNFGPGDAKVRPYFLFGLGATNYGGTDYTGPNGRTGTLAAFTQFSTTWGAGVKGYGSGHVGYRAGASWTPTYIKSDSVGWWCDPYWGCYVVGDPQYANQFSLNGGVLFKF